MTTLPHTVNQGHSVQGHGGGSLEKAYPAMLREQVRGGTLPG
jgi:hypothetical protein